ncbi:MAG: hypothetical protein MHM6MM_002625 [Cercozoa sp. M6MM]
MLGRRFLSLARTRDMKSAGLVREVNNAQWNLPILRMSLKDKLVMVVVMGLSTTTGVYLVDHFTTVNLKLNLTPPTDEEARQRADRYVDQVVLLEELLQFQHELNERSRARTLSAATATE